MLRGAGPLMLRGAGLTHPGKLRERNEDAILTDPEGVLWAVADGMGGYGHGDMASDMVIDRLAALSDSAPAGPGLRMQIDEANRAIRAKAAEPGMNAMGATVVAVMIQNGAATIAWVGDCRAYLWRRAELRLLTRDHTVVRKWSIRAFCAPTRARPIPNGTSSPVPSAPRHRSMSIP